MDAKINLHMGRPREDFVTKLITRDEWKLVCKIRQAEICAAKMKFQTETAAMAEVIHRMSRIDNPAPMLRAYQCEVCNQWHLSSREKRKPNP